jgi:8-oxo-dGTP pyrophosphatase MutT (NUDIX family)
MSEKIQNREKFKFSSAVFLLVLDGDNILLLLRNDTGWFDNHYSIPGGIKEKNEPLHLAAIREATEEVGIIVKPEDVTLVHLMHNLTTGEEWTGAFFVVNHWEGEPAIKEPHKHSELKWVPILELPENMSPYVRQAIKHYTAGLFYSMFGWELPADSTEEDYKAYYQ